MHNIRNGGGRNRNRLFMCGDTSFYSLFVNTQGATGSYLPELGEPKRGQ